MSEFSKNTYKFGNFFFDGNKLALYHQNQLIKNGGEKSLRVLAVLLQNANALASHDEIIEQVWQDNISGVTSAHIAQYIGKLRKVLAEYAPKTEFIENVKGRGYMFVGDVESGAIETSQELPLPPSESLFDYDEPKHELPIKNRSRRNFMKSVYVFAAVIAVSAISLTAWSRLANNDEQKIRRVVEDSQKFESLVLYENPTEFDEAQLTKYWLPDTDFNADFDIREVRNGVKRLVDEGRYYGKETKPEQFDFQSVEINTSKDFAVVKTLEKWFIVEYRKDGTLLKTKNVGPYFVSYILRKADGHWLIEKSNTARAEPASTQQ